MAESDWDDDMEAGDALDDVSDAENVDSGSDSDSEWVPGRASDDDDDDVEQLDADGNLADLVVPDHDSDVEDDECSNSESDDDEQYEVKQIVGFDATPGCPMQWHVVWADDSRDWVDVDKVNAPQLISEFVARYYAVQFRIVLSE